MSIFLQHLLVLAFVGVCFGAVGWQGVKILFGKRSRLGSCCAKGCEAVKESQQKPAGEKVQFIPADMLGRRK